jgi:putative transposase
LTCFELWRDGIIDAKGRKRPAQQKTKFLSIGKPMDNATIESFNGSFRDECLNVNWFLSMEDAREKIEKWRRDYNEFRPHSALGDLNPHEFIDNFRKSMQSQKTSFLAGPVLRDKVPHGPVGNLLQNRSPLHLTAAQDDPLLHVRLLPEGDIYAWLSQAQVSAFIYANITVHYPKN